MTFMSKAKLEQWNCKKLWILWWGGDFFHNENSGCNISWTDYTLIRLTAEASLYQQSSLKFDIWPYVWDHSYTQQNELKYFIK